MPKPSMPPRRLITTRTLPPVAPNAVCRKASPNTEVATMAVPVAAIPWRKRRRDSRAASSYSRQQSVVVVLVIGVGSSTAHVVGGVEEHPDETDEHPLADRVVLCDDGGRSVAGGRDG